MEKKITQEQKLKVLEDPVVKQVLYDILHKRRSKYSIADNSGQHVDYQNMVEDLKADYKREISKQSK